MKKSLLILLIAIPAIGICQETILAEIGDVIALEPSDTYRGTIHWQFSGDNASWEDIDGGNMPVFEVTLNSLPGYFRARVSEEGCEFDHYSDVIEVLSAAEAMPMV